MDHFTAGHIGEELGPAGIVGEPLPNFSVWHWQIHLGGDSATPGGVGTGVEQDFTLEQGTEIVAGGLWKLSLGNNHGTSPKMV